MQIEHQSDAHGVSAEKPPDPPSALTSRWAKWNPRHWLRVILMADDTPHNIALGTAIGVFVGLTPTWVIQTALILLVAAITRPFFKFNIVAAVVAGQVTNPITNIPIYWCEYVVGTWFVQSGDVTFDRFAELFRDQTWNQWWIDVKLLAVDIGKPLLVGSAIVATLSALVTYPLIKRLVHRMKQRRPSS